MTQADSATSWTDEGHAYSVVSEDRGIATRERSGLSHGDAMILAETLRHQRSVVRVMHVLGENSYEVDRYPLR